MPHFHEHEEEAAPRRRLLSAGISPKRGDFQAREERKEGRKEGRRKERRQGLTFHPADCGGGAA